MQVRPRRHKQGKRGLLQQKILLLLLGGLALGCSRRPDTSWKIIGEMAKEWEKISRQSAERAIQSLYESKLLEARENPDGTTTLVLNEKGERKALTYKTRYMKVSPPAAWDKTWWLILFDVPEDEREARDAFREHLEDMGFFCLQKSAWMYPFDCRNEIEFLVEMLDIRKYVRVMRVTNVDNEPHLKKFFNLS